MRRIRRTRRATALGSVAAALIACGSSIMVYPSTAAWFAEAAQSQVGQSYSQEAAELGPADRHASLAAAHAYNSALTGGAVVDPLLERVSDGSGEVAAEYRSLLSLDEAGVMARVRVPAIGVDLPIYHGTSEAVLRRGVGHLFGTALPVGGEGGHTVLTAHRGLPESTLFSDLDQVAVGDLVQVEVYGEVLTYRVRDTRVVQPEETHSLYPVAGDDLVTLITCTPLGINTHRILVTAERIPTPAANEPALVMPPIPGPPWWAVGLAGALGLSTAVLTGTARPRTPASGAVQSATALAR
ncbi:class C sortase [Agrococcus sp. Marseille-P2731]|uniref:class C sortase n=1 Tax=Agrococcus sp. Marseille-P2731 TaxID=1841862 RepID=UPI000931A8BF|nr:class C sortase [Agrococcus sp. Marseille-P2731]